MQDNNIMLLLKCFMFSGIFLIALGLYFHFFSATIDAMGISGFIISAACVAIGMILSIPTKMVMTFYLVSREINRDKKSHIK